MNRQEKDRGSLTVECLLIVIPVMCFFFSLVNISRYVQAEVIIHHAITQAAKEISVYSYVFTKTGISEEVQATNKQSSEFQTTTEETINSVTKFMSSFGDLADSDDIISSVEEVFNNGQTAYTSVTDYFSDPEELLAGVLAVAKSEAEGYVLTYVAGAISRGVVKETLSYMTDDPDAYLEGIGIEGGISGLDFSQSNWISNETGTKANIEITVTYTMHNLMFPQFDFGEHQYRLCASTSIW